jgi:hypothetical protein
MLQLVTGIIRKIPHDLTLTFMTLILLVGVVVAIYISHNLSGYNYSSCMKIKPKYFVKRHIVFLAFLKEIPRYKLHACERYGYVIYVALLIDIYVIPVSFFGLKCDYSDGIFGVLLNPCSQIQGYFFKIDHDRFSSLRP